MCIGTEYGARVMRIVDPGACPEARIRSLVHQAGLMKWHRYSLGFEIAGSQIDDVLVEQFDIVTHCSRIVDIDDRYRQRRRSGILAFGTVWRFHNCGLLIDGIIDALSYLF